MADATTVKEKAEQEVRMVDIYVTGKRYKVPEGLTIQTALEYCGYNIIRSCGCRAGFCGACSTIYNFTHDPTIRYGLACQTRVEQNMVITQIPFFPAAQALYNLEDLKPEEGENKLLTLYPDIITCFGCNNCTKTCPQDLEVMEFISDAIRGDTEKVYQNSFDCLMCGLCAARCPQGLQPYNIALAARRLRGAHLTTRSQHNEDRIKEIEKGKFDAEIEKLKKADEVELRRMYAAREIEPAL
ncbi:MAG: 4Fe-4S ferredoxin [Chloroflexi bacterium]|nr:MAG: 4Fe-4S ferredoxin [Chloroflexota bacterium]